MYLDTRGLVTTGVGNLIDDGTPGPACGLPWVHKGDGRAMLDEVADAWHRVKAAQSMAPLGGGHFAGLTDMRLLDADIDALVLRRVDEMEWTLRDGFAGWDEFPAACQLAVLDMAWNMGPSFGFPKFRAACDAQDWQAAAAECHIAGAPAARNEAHVALLTYGGDPDTLPKF